MRNLVPLLPILSFLSFGCSSSDPAETAKPPVGTGDCTKMPVAEAVPCAEAQFWAAFQQPGLDKRAANEQTLVAVAAKADAEGGDKKARSLMHFRLGQLRLAMALENEKRDYAIKSQTMIVGEFDVAMALDPYDGIIAPWKDAMEIAMAAILSDWEKGVTLAQRGFDNVALNPMGNTLSLSGTTIGFPLSTGVPQKTVALIDAWKCANVAWCTENTDHGPWVRPGLEFHFAEAYARVGDRAKTKQHLDAALAAPGADKWPYRSIAADAAADLDGFLGKFSKLGEDGSAFDIAYANQKYGCVFCHQK